MQYSLRRLLSATRTLVAFGSEKSGIIDPVIWRHFRAGPRHVWLPVLEPSTVWLRTAEVTSDCEETQI